MPKCFIERTVPAAILASLVAASAALATPGGGKSGATITASFADSCRDFAAHSSKDISHVEFHYAAGAVTKDESINDPDYAVDGGAGEEIQFAVVKSGTTSEQFDCVQSNEAPTALLEIQTPPMNQTAAGCFPFWAGGLSCQLGTPRTDWTSASEVPDDGGTDSGLFHWVCGFLGDLCPSSTVVILRGTGSSDPDGDIASWTLDFGDGTSVSGSWSTALPTEVAHEYPLFVSLYVITLTVTDSAGQSDSDAILMCAIDQSPD
jgi:hypothetical protein